MSDGRCAGVDWASEEHAVCVVDEHGRILEGRRYRHDEPGIRAFCARLVRLEVALVALERPDGLLIERLLDAGLAVIAVHPNQVKAMRPRYSGPDPRAHQPITRSRHRLQRLRAIAVGRQHPEAVAVGPRELSQHEAVKAVALAAPSPRLRGD
jgi:hypothetical protein